jgi:4-amino-4-deoxy-L-arabinose transferase-like glycosyltransferase
MSTLRPLDYLLIVLGLLAVYGLGLTLPILNSDPAFNATVALNMYLSGDYFSLTDQFGPYLDKPHLSFWLAAGSFELFGVSVWAYRLPSVLVSLLGLYATYRLGREAYSREVGVLAAVVLATMQAQILANHDVRMDALLTGFIAVGAWQLFRYLRTGEVAGLIWGAIMAGLAFNTKGMVGVGVLGIAFMVEVIHRRAWYRLFTWDLPEALVAFILTILPVLGAYYAQFDLHPELEVAGQKGVSGVKFILWDQNFERMAGGRFGTSSANDPFFFFHTLLWASLPWSLLIFAAWIVRFFRPQQVTEWFTGGGALVCMLVFSFSSFKLPHYLNILFPLLAVWAAGWFYQGGFMPRKGGWYFRVWVQTGVPLLMIIVSQILVFWVFKGEIASWQVATSTLLGFALIRYLVSVKYPLRRALAASALGALYVNLILNGVIYPELNRYQAGNQLAYVIQREQVKAGQVYFAEGTPLFYDLELGIQRIIPYLSPAQVRERLQTQPTLWLVIDPARAADYLSPGVKLVKQRCYSDFHITRLTAQFLNPATRQSTLHKYCLIGLSRQD